MPKASGQRWALALILVMAALATPAVGAPPAEARVVWVVSGAGFGHGVGMSQYGAYGFARRGADYRAILAHYYTDTSVGSVGSETVSVLLRSGSRRIKFRGPTAACGRTLNPRSAYAATARGRRVILRNRKGRRIRVCGPALTTSGGWVKVGGKGSYRGTLRVRASRRGLAAVNVVAIDDYVRGVVARESPSSWPIEALKAQAVAARSYAIATRRGRWFDHYDDTRSQVYGGIRAETAPTDRAVAATAHEVVLHRGEVAETYFSSTSGGHTESNENSFLGGTPLPYLRGVPDPYDSDSPHHRWRRKFSQRSIQSRLGGYVRGKLKRIEVLTRGASPRIVKARVVGSRGSRTISGPALKARLGLRDTWASFAKKRR